MDYVVYGTGYGATLMLLGYALRTWGPRWRFANQNEAAYDRREFRSAQSAWSRFTSGLGAVIATSGAVLALFTILIMLINPGDGVGVIVTLVISVAALIGVAVWAWLYFDRYGAWGVLATPEPLSSYTPLHYDARLATAPAGGKKELDEPDVSEPEDQEQREDVVDHDEDESDIAIRYTKYETHHPDGDDDDANEPIDAETDEPETADEIAADKAEVDTQAAGDKPAVDKGTVDVEPDGGEVLDTTGKDDVEDGVAASGDETLGDDVTIDIPVESDADETLEVLPEAHEEDVTPEIPQDVSDAGEEPVKAPGGREDALRRLRERRAQRGSSRTEDA